MVELEIYDIESSNRSSINSRNALKNIKEDLGNVKLNNKGLNKSAIVFHKEKKLNKNKSTLSKSNHSDISLSLKINQLKKKLDFNNSKCSNHENQSIFSSYKDYNDTNGKESINNSSSSSRKRRIRLPFFDSSHSEEPSVKEIKEMNKICLICEEILTNEELIDNKTDCYHGFCNDCYYNYFKEKINNNEIEKIKCPEKDCNNFFSSNFIEEKLNNDKPLVEKYNKLIKRRQLMLDPNIQLCPFVDCESYAKKDDNTKFVSCIDKGHKFCFNCLKDWHYNEPCKDDIDKSFKNWRNSYKVKRCPRCKYFIEKNEGCNHMTCFNCKYQFCWFCEKEYDSNHFSLGGKCFGLQYAECSCFSNILIRFLYQFLIFLLKNVIFAISASFIFAMIFIYDKFEDYNHPEFPCFTTFLFFASVILLFISFASILMSISTAIAVLMTIIWPLHTKIFNLIESIF